MSFQRKMSRYFCGFGCFLVVDKGPHSHIVFTLTWSSPHPPVSVAGSANQEGQKMYAQQQTFRQVFWEDGLLGCGEMFHSGHAWKWNVSPFDQVCSHCFRFSIIFDQAIWYVLYISIGATTIYYTERITILLCVLQLRSSACTKLDSRAWSWRSRQLLLPTGYVRAVRVPQDVWILS